MLIYADIIKFEGQGLVKDKGGDITLVSNYRAIAISNVETKLLESIMLNKVRVHNDFDKYQYGFKKGHSTGLCTLLSVPLNIMWIVVAMCLLLSLTSLKRLIALITGYYLISCLMMV